MRWLRLPRLTSKIKLLKDGNNLLSILTIYYRTIVINKIKEESGLDWNGDNCKRISYGLHKTLIDFELISPKNDILYYSIDSFTFLYLLFDLHFQGLSDMEVWNSLDWQLFNMDKFAVIEMIKDYSLKGGYVAQTTGDLLSITWTYKSMEELIDATL
jgi:hypothetical protein